MAGEMKAWEIGPQAGLDSLHMVERTEPVPGQGEVSVRVYAACLNHRDLLTLQNRYGGPKPETRIPLSDGVGTVEAVGDGVDANWIGKRVTAPHFVGWLDGQFSPAVFGQDLGITRNGWLAEKIVLPEAALITVPDTLSDDQVAAIPAVGATVWSAIVDFAGIKPGELLLAPGTGGVSIAALQIGKALGAKVAITSSSDAKLEQCRALGADYLINYRTRPDWPAALAEATGGRGADVVVDTVGFASLGETIAATAPNGRIALIGALSGLMEQMPNMFGIIGKNLTLKGITSGSRAMLAEVLGLMERSNLNPVIDKVFAFDDAPMAYAHLESGAHLGKVMVRF
jgi:NADPH:quinone reductase-like Zn-dependent oxidoreductase